MATECVHLNPCASVGGLLDCNKLKGACSMATGSLLRHSSSDPINVMYFMGSYGSDL